MVWEELKKLTKTNREKKRSKYSHLSKLVENYKKENIFIKYKYNEKLQNSLEQCISLNGTWYIV